MSNHDVSSDDLSTNRAKVKTKPKSSKRKSDTSSKKLRTCSKCGEEYTNFTLHKKSCSENSESCSKCGQTYTNKKDHQAVCIALQKREKLSRKCTGKLQGSSSESEKSDVDSN